MNPTPQPNTATYRPFLERLGGSPISEFVGEYGEIFYDPANPTIESLRISDGETPGGLLLAQNVIDRVTEIYESIDGSKLAEIQEVIQNFVDSGIEEYEVLLERLLDLEENAVRRTGDSMTGGLKITNSDGYKYELIPSAEGRPAGTCLFTYNDQVVAEQYWDPVEQRINFYFPPGVDDDATSFAALNGNDALQIGNDALEVFTDTRISGGLYVNDVDVIQEIERIKIELLAEVAAIIVTLGTKFNKTGGVIAGELDVKPNGLAGISHFKVTTNAVETLIPPTTDFSVVNKKYVDDTTIPFNLRKLQALPS